MSEYSSIETETSAETIINVLIELLAREFYADEREHSEWTDIGGES